MTGFGSAGVAEIVEDNRGDTYRAVYTAEFSGWVYVLHCFQKKSKSGLKTPKEDMELITPDSRPRSWTSRPGNGNKEHADEPQDRDRDRRRQHQRLH